VIFTLVCPNVAVRDLAALPFQLLARLLCRDPVRFRAFLDFHVDEDFEEPSLPIGDCGLNLPSPVQNQ
jgi:hypothetical protein